jgi:hypothetical protein
MKTKTHTDNLALARRIRAAGVAIYIGEDDGETPHDPPSGLRIRLFGGVVESRAIDFHGGAAYIIYCRITVNLPRFAIAGFGLELPWKGTVRWLDEPFEIDGSSKMYRFGGRYDPAFEKDEVLNHLADVRRTLSQGKSLQGALLAIGEEPIAEQFQHGAMIPAFLIVYDQFGRDYRSPIQLWADRSEKLLGRSRSGVPRKRLFDCPDPKVKGTRSNTTLVTK